MNKGDIMLIITISAIIVLGWMVFGGRKKERRKGPVIKAQDYINMYKNNKK